MEETIIEYNGDEPMTTDWGMINKIIQEECEKGQSKLDSGKIVFSSEIENNIKRRLEEA